MSEPLPTQLVATLERLGLATAGEVARMRRRVRRLARDLPKFESVWVDALVQARVLTPFQAAEINAGRIESLRLGPFLLQERLSYPYYVSCYRAIDVDSHKTVRLAVADGLGSKARSFLDAIQSLIPKGDSLLFVTHAGVEGERLFAATPWFEGRSAAEWMVHHGRFPPGVVLEIARAMLAALVEFEKAGICHSDIGAASLLLSDSGDVSLSLPGLRGVLRPEEGYAHADLLPEAYDTLAPERIADGVGVSIQSDIYACGCLWWHLLCGRPPLAGGDSLAKLRAAQEAEICDVRRYALDVPDLLATTIAECLQRRPDRRPESMARLASMLGPPTADGKAMLADYLSRAGRPVVPWTTTVRTIRKSRRTPLWIAGAVCCLTAVVALAWPTLGARPAEAQKTASTAASSATPVLPMPSPPPGAADDGEVVPVAYSEPQLPPEDFVLPSDKPTAIGSLELRPGQCVRGPSGKRAVVLVAESGLTVEQENIRFENVDFLRQHQPTEGMMPDTSALIHLHAGRAEFRGCSFRCEGGGPNPSAILWRHPANRNDLEASLPSGQIKFINCLFDRVDSGVDCQTIGALAVEVKNTLHLHAGPLIRFDHCPQADEPASIVLTQVTLRGGGPLIEFLMPRMEPQPGEIDVFATQCAFVPGPNVPLVSLKSPEFPGRILSAIRWSGQGSLLSPESPIVAWDAPGGRCEPLDDSALSMAGIVRSPVGFSAKASGDPSASRLIHWQAPLQSPDPPGIDPNPLPPAMLERR